MTDIISAMTDIISAMTETLSNRPFNRHLFYASALIFSLKYFVVVACVERGATKMPWKTNPTAPTLNNFFNPHPNRS